MYLSHMMGFVSTQPGTPVDLPLLILFMPLCLFITLIMIFKTYIITSKRGVNVGIKYANLALIILISLFFVEKISQGFNGAAAVGFLTNVDILVGAIFAGLILFRKMGLARAFMPSIIILAGASMFNNYGSSIDVLQMVTDMLAIALSIFIGVFTNKLISTNSFFLTTAFTTTLVIYSYFINSNLAQIGLAVFDHMASEKAKIMLISEITKMATFIGAIVLFKFFIWFISRLFIVIRQGGSLRDLMFWKERRAWMQKGLEFSQKLFGIKFFKKLGSHFENAEEEKEAELLAEPVKYEIQFTIIPQAIRNIFNAQGIRAPSLSF